MRTIIKGTQSIKEYKELQQRLQTVAATRYAEHLQEGSTWEEGEPVRTWQDQKGICIEYASGIVERV